VVDTVLLGDRDGPPPVSYRLLATDSRWAVVDVVVDGVSLAANYRVQFGRVLREASYETLVRRMRKKLDDEPR
jgi:phospholipid transport system substrate-binding protein